MTTGNKNSDYRHLLWALVLILIGVSVVQSIFLVKLQGAVDKDASTLELKEYQDNDPGVKEDLLKGFKPGTWNPFKELQLMRREMERMFDNYQNRFELSPSLNGHEKTFDFRPQTDIEEKKDRFIVKINIPGADESEIKVDLQDDILSVTAQTKSLMEDRGTDDFLMMERSIGSFHRSFSLPSPVDEGKMETKYEDGVLTIIIQKVGL